MEPPKTMPGPALRLPKRLQDVPRTLQDDSSWPQDALETHRDVPKTRPWGGLKGFKACSNRPGGSRARFWSLWAWILEGLGPPNDHAKQHFKLKISSIDIVDLWNWFLTWTACCHGSTPLYSTGLHWTPHYQPLKVHGRLPTDAAVSA